MNKSNHADFIPTQSGLYFDYCDIMNNEVSIEDIAHALSHLCRFGGHVPEFYSVAQHSVLVSRIVPDEMAVAALLHDATEAFVQDLVRPVKRHCRDYQAVELMVAYLIDMTFEVDTRAPAVKVADNMALYAEGMSFFGDVSGWGLDDYAHDYIVVDPVPPKAARVMFLDRWEELTNGRLK